MVLCFYNVANTWSQFTCYTAFESIVPLYPNYTYTLPYPTLPYPTLSYLSSFYTFLGLSDTSAQLACSSWFFCFYKVENTWSRFTCYTAFDSIVPLYLTYTYTLPYPTLPYPTYLTSRHCSVFLRNQCSSLALRGSLFLQRWKDFVPVDLLYCF